MLGDMFQRRSGGGGKIVRFWLPLAGGGVKGKADCNHGLTQTERRRGSLVGCWFRLAAEGNIVSCDLAAELGGWTE